MEENKKKVIVKGWKKLQPFAIVRLLCCIIDPDEESDVEDLLAAIAEKFDIEYASDKGFIVRLNNLLVTIWRRNKRTFNPQEVVFEVPIMGSIRLVKSYWEYIYEKDDIIYANHYHPTAFLEVNGRIQESRVYEEAKVMELEGDIRTMFENYGGECSYSDYFYMIEKVFKKGNMDMSLFRSACEQITTMVYGVDCMKDEYPDTMTTCGRFIFDKYMEYLWGQEDEEKAYQYRLGLNSFIHQNLPHWLDGADGFRLQCNIYTEEHKQIVEMFKAKEPDTGYLHHVGDFLNLEVWKNWTKSSYSL